MDLSALKARVFLGVTVVLATKVLLATTTFVILTVVQIFSVQTDIPALVTAVPTGGSVTPNLTLVSPLLQPLSQALLRSKPVTTILKLAQLDFHVSLVTAFLTALLTVSVLMV